MIQLIYTSAETVPFSPEALNASLFKARQRNSVYKVSGMLLYDSGSFLQVLEGPEDAVETILTSILREGRHGSQKVLSRLKVERRDFAEWSMAFVDSSLSLRRPAGLVDYSRVLPGLPDASAQAQRFIRYSRKDFAGRAWAR